VSSPRRTALLTLLKLCDLAVVTASLVLAVALTSGRAGIHGWQEVFSLRLTFLNSIFVGCYLVAWHYVLKTRGLYESYRLSPASRELKDVGAAVAIATAPLIPISLLLDFEYVTTEFLLAFPSLAFVALAIERRLLRAIARRVRSLGRNLRDVVIVGDGGSALAAAARLARRESLGYRVVEVLTIGTPGVSAREGDTDGAEAGADGPGADARTGGLVADGGRAAPAAALAIDGAVADGSTGAPAVNGESADASAVERLAALLEQRPVDEVFLALPLDGSAPLIRPIIALCEEQGVTVRVIAQLAALDWGRATIDTLGEQPVITISSGPHESLTLVAKRLLDLAGATVGLVLLSPLFLLVAIAIKLDSRGPVFFSQERVGLHRRRFPALKFRTMVAGAEALQQDLEPLNEAEGPVFKIEHDPRITRVGHLLRRTSLDELPQLLNVLLGQMSLVGPRPLPVRDVRRIDVRWHHRRFSVKPGMTCIWQVRSREPRFDEWIRADMEYIDNWSLGLDLKILARTIPAVISGQGAR